MLAQRGTAAAPSRCSAPPSRPGSFRGGGHGALGDPPFGDLRDDLDINLDEDHFDYFDFLNVVNFSVLNAILVLLLIVVMLLPTVLLIENVAVLRARLVMPPSPRSARMPLMGLRISFDLDDSLTFGDLYRFVDHARAAGLDDDQRVTVERTDNIGNPVDVHTLAADLGDVEELSRPALWFHREDLDRFTPLLERELAQERQRGPRRAHGPAARDVGSTARLRLTNPPAWRLTGVSASHFGPSLVV